MIILYQMAYFITFITSAIFNINDQFRTLSLHQITNKEQLQQKSRMAASTLRHEANWGGN